MMKKNAMVRGMVLLVGICVLAAIHGCGGGGGGGGSAPAVTAPSVTTASLPSGVRGQLYTGALGGAGGSAPYRWSASGLPPGISLDGDTGALSGMPTTDDSYTPVFTVTDDAGLSASRTLSLVIHPPPAPSVSTTSLPPGIRSQPYSAVLEATSGMPPYTWSVPFGTLPTGVSLDPSTGALTGTPTVEGTFNMTFTVTDSNTLTGSELLAITIDPPPSPSVSTVSLPSGIRSQPYSAVLAASSGTPPYTWSVAAGTLPTGVDLNPANGMLTGTPTVEGTFSVTFAVRDSNALAGSRPLSIRINPPASPVIVSSGLPAGARTESYTATLSATGGTPPYSWSATGLPDGLTLSAAGTLAGTPSVEGTFSPVFTVADFLSTQAQKSLELRIAKPLSLAVSDYSTPSGAVDMFDSASVANGASAWSRQLKGALTTLDNTVGGPPAGASFDAVRNILYVARTRWADNGAILAFHDADAAAGNVAPTRTISTYAIVPKTFSLYSPSDVFIDSGNDRIYIADVTGSYGTILVMDRASTAPTFRRIFGFLFGPPAAISLDVGRDILYVVPSQGTAIIAYDNVSTPSSRQRTIAIGPVAGVGLVDVKIDPSTDTAYVADYDGGRVFVVNSASQKNGTYAPDRTLTGLSNPNSVFPDVANDRLFVSNRDGATSYSVRVVENMSSVNGPVSFSRQLSGFGVAAGMTGHYR